jgi:hypothetical protein
VIASGRSIWPVHEFSSNFIRGSMTCQGERHRTS